MQIVRNILIALLLVQAPLALAQGVSAKGVGQVTFSKKITATVKQEALQKAKVNAIETYFSQVGDDNKSRNFDLMRSKIVGDIDSYVLNASVLDEELDEKLGTYKVIVSASINKPRLENALVDTSAVANATSNEKSMLTFVFVARYKKSVTVHDDKVHKEIHAKEDASINAKSRSETTESEKIGAASTTAGDKSRAQSKASAEYNASVDSDGSVEHREDTVVWDIASSSELENMMAGAFADARYDVVSAGDVEAGSGGQLSIAAIRKDFGTGDDIGVDTRRSAAGGARAVGVRYFALGTMDIGTADKDPATGLTRVHVTVNGQVLDVSGRLSRLVSAVGPEQFAGLGPDKDVARLNALKLAAESAAKKLLNSLNAKGAM